MQILATGDQERYEALQQHLNEVATVEYSPQPPKSLEGYDALFDLNLDDQPANLAHYKDFDGKLVIGSAVKRQLADMSNEAGGSLKCDLFGINALPTFLERNIQELSVLNQADEKRLQDLTGKLGWDYQLVDDRVGMVAPRVILMIINEAAYTLQEGTASQADINKSLKLGTNYPYGPFEWADRIGIKHVYEALHAIYHDTGDERYKICPLLKTHYLKNEGFNAV